MTVSQDTPEKRLRPAANARMSMTVPPLKPNAAMTSDPMPLPIAPPAPAEGSVAARL